MSGKTIKKSDDLVVTHDPVAHDIAPNIITATPDRKKKISLEDMTEYMFAILHPQKQEEMRETCKIPRAGGI